MRPEQAKGDERDTGTELPSSGAVTSVSCGDIPLCSAPLEFIFRLRDGALTHVVTVNAEIFVYAHEDPRLREILRGTINTIDGRVLQWLCRVLYPREGLLRLTGANFIYALAEHCCERCQRLFLLGSDCDTNAAGVKALRRRFPGLSVSGYAPPFAPYPFPMSLNQKIFHEISAFRPQHLVVCFGPRKQEYWIHENSECLVASGVCCAYGLGGTIDFLAGKRKWAPMWVQQAGMAWLFRLLCEPRRFRRTLGMFRMPYYVARTRRRIERFSPPRGGQ